LFQKRIPKIIPECPIFTSDATRFGGNSKLMGTQLLWVKGVYYGLIINKISQALVELWRDLPTITSIGEFHFQLVKNF
jgi:hypothetical protein